MALPKQNVSISFAQGVDTKTDPKQVIPGKLLTLENGIFETADSIRKRNGYTALTQSILGGGSISSAVGLATFKSELVLPDGLSLYGYSPSLPAMVEKGVYQPVSVSSTSVYHDAYTNSTMDSAYHAGSNLSAYVWRRDGVYSGIYYSVIDNETGEAVVSGGTIDASATLCKVFTLGSYFVVTYHSGADLKYRAIPVASPSAPQAAVTLASDFSGSDFNYDGSVFNSRLYVAYNNNAGGGGISLKYLDTSLVLSSATSINGDAATGCIAIWGDASNNAWVAYANSSDVKGFAYDSSLVTPVFTTKTIETRSDVVRITGIFASGSTSQVFYEVSQSGIYNHFIVTNTFGTSAVGTAAVLIRSLGLTGKAFSHGGVPYVVANYWSSTQSAVFVVNGATGALLAKILPELTNPQIYSQLTEVSATGATTFQMALLKSGQNVVIGAGDGFPGVITAIYGISSATLDFSASAEALEGGGDLLLTGGFLSMYDGANVVEHGFHVFPEQIPSTTPSTTGGSVAAGDYQYCAVYEWTDCQGQVHRSAPSLPVSVTVGGTTLGSVSVDLPTLRLSAKAQVTIGLYRTTAGPGTIFFRVNPETSLILNDPSVDTVTYVDTNADATIEGQSQLYTTGGEVENIAPPAPLTMASYKTRVVVIPADDRQSWWFTKDIIPGSPAEFSDLFVQHMDPRGGDLTAVSQMDDKLVFFKRRNKFYVVGDGPAPSGANNDFSSPQIIPSDSGCISAASVVLTPDGLMYQSEKGIWLLDRSLNDSYIGAPVEAYNGDTVTSAELIPDTTQVRFTLDSGVALVYDYLFHQWSVFTNHDAAGATIFQDVYCFVSAGGKVLEETPGTYTDDGAFVRLKLVTSWLSFAGLQGFQRVYEMLVLGTYASPHTLQIDVAYDFDPTVAQTEDIVASSTAPYQYQLSFWRQKCETVQLTIQDTQGAPYGEGLSLSAFGMEVGVKGGLNRMSQNRSYG